MDKEIKNRTNLSRNISILVLSMLFLMEINCIYLIMNWVSKLRNHNEMDIILKSVIVALVVSPLKGNFWTILIFQNVLSRKFSTIGINYLKFFHVF